MERISCDCGCTCTVTYGCKFTYNGCGSSCCPGCARRTSLLSEEMKAMGRGTNALMTKGYRWKPSFSGDSFSIAVPGKGCGCFTPGLQFRCGVCTARTPGVGAGSLPAAPRAPLQGLFL